MESANYVPVPDSVCSQANSCFIIFARRSEYFRTLFISDFEDARESALAFEECCGPALLQLVEAIYRHEVRCRMCPGGSISSGANTWMYISFILCLYSSDSERI